MHSHSHPCSCTHSDVRYCSHCQTVYCTNCNQEWRKSSIWAYSQYPYGQYGNTLIRSGGLVQGNTTSFSAGGGEDAQLTSTATACTHGS